VRGARSLPLCSHMTFSVLSHTTPKRGHASSAAVVCHRASRSCLAQVESRAGDARAALEGAGAAVQPPQPVALHDASQNKSPLSSAHSHVTKVSSLSEKLSRGETGAKDAATRKNTDKGTVPEALLSHCNRTNTTENRFQVRKHLAEQKEILALEHGQVPPCSLVKQNPKPLSNMPLRNLRSCVARARRS
jgi:hypothetical protein